MLASCGGADPPRAPPRGVARRLRGHDEHAVLRARRGRPADLPGRARRSGRRARALRARRPRLGQALLRRHAAGVARGLPRARRPPPRARVRRAAPRRRAQRGRRPGGGARGAAPHRACCRTRIPAGVLRRAPACRGAGVPATPADPVVERSSRVRPPHWRIPCDAAVSRRRTGALSRGGGRHGGAGAALARGVHRAPASWPPAQPAHGDLATRVAHEGQADDARRARRAPR